MNRLFAALLAAALVALAGFAIVVFTAGGPPAPGPEPAAPAAPVAIAPGAAARFDAWAAPLRADGLTVTAEGMAEAGDTVTLANLAIAGPAETPGWRWTAERAALYDKELFHLQAAGATAFTVTTAAGADTVWSGRADAIGVAMTRDPRDALGRTIILRVNGLALAPAGTDAAPMTLADGQLRILRQGGTGLLTPGTDIALRLTDLTVPPAAGTAYGSRVKSFTAQLLVDRPVTRYSLRDAFDYLARRDQTLVELGAVALDWGTLHAIGKGAFGLSLAGAPRGRFEVTLRDPLGLLDALAAASAALPATLADTYAALLLALGAAGGDSLPLAVAVTGGAFVLAAPGGDIALGPAPSVPPPQ
jgi:hypothetical protein